MISIDRFEKSLKRVSRLVKGKNWVFLLWETCDIAF
jgi:hypothetical protein